MNVDLALRVRKSIPKKLAYAKSDFLDLLNFLLVFSKFEFLDLAQFPLNLALNRFLAFVISTTSTISTANFFVYKICSFIRVCFQHYV